MGSNSFYVNNELIEIMDGDYDELLLVQEINKHLPGGIDISYNSISSKFSFTSVVSFNLNFDYFENNQMYYNKAKYGGNYYYQYVMRI
jgi:hypothetical protein